MLKNTKGSTKEQISSIETSQLAADRASNLFVDLASDPENSDSRTPFLRVESLHNQSTLRLKYLKYLNRLVTIAGMTSLGVLAGLITHHFLEDQKWPIWGIIAGDVMSFFTAIAGKVAIVLFPLCQRQ